MKKRHYLISIDTTSSYLIDVKAHSSKEAKRKAQKILDKNMTYYTKKVVMVTSSIDDVDVGAVKG